MSKRKIIAAAGMTAALATGGIVGATLGLPNASGAQDGTTTTTAPADPAAPEGGGGHAGRGFGGGAELDAAAKALGISTDDLRADLADGKTIAEVATAQKVDKQEVVDAMVAAAEARLEEQKAALPERMAAIVDGTAPTGGPGGGRGGPGGPGRGGPGASLSTAAKALGLTEAELRTALQADDASLATVAKAQGVDVQKVIDALVAEAKTRIAAEVKDGNLTQAEADDRLADLTDRITERVNSTDGPGRGGPGGPGGFGHGGPPPAGDGTTTTTEGD